MFFADAESGCSCAGFFKQWAHFRQAEVEDLGVAAISNE